MFTKIKDFFKTKKAYLKEKLSSKTLKGYKIKDDKIIVNYGLFNKLEVENTKENIELLNEQLRRQYENTDIDKIVTKTNKWSKAASAFSISGVAFALINLFLAPVAPWIALPSFILANASLVGLLGSLGGYYYNANKIDKYNKVCFLDENKDKLNEEINHTESDTMTKKKIKNSGLRTKSAILKEKHENREVFDINTINNMSLEGLKKVRANLEALRTPVVENQEGPKLVLENK